MNVILDALIPRDDFEVQNPEGGRQTPARATLSISDLKDGSYFMSVIRKPDFQRETNEWNSKKIIGLIKSYINGDLIPAVILWQSASSYTFVIDGAHRLSALAAWINDDYGDGPISKRFFASIIPEEQLALAERTREAVRKQVGPFSEYERAVHSPQSVKPEIRELAKMLPALAVQVQWVNGGADKAEDSFFLINQEAVPIDKTELRLLKSRRKPNGIAARAISRSGTGHKYWAGFTDKNQKQVEIISKEIHQMLFTPPLKTPIKTLDLPIGGKLYSQQTLALILELTNIANDIKEDTDASDDVTGNLTVAILQQCRRITRRINSSSNGSLGLDAAVYFYSKDGRYKPASFYSVALFVKGLDGNAAALRNFTDVRAAFEQVLLENDFIPEQILRKARSASAGYPHIVNYYEIVLEALHKGVLPSAMLDYLQKTKEFKYIARPSIHHEDQAADFSIATKSAVFMREALVGHPKCKICGGYIHRNAMSIDHIARKQDGGMGRLDNGQLSHPYCNTTYKN